MRAVIIDDEPSSIRVIKLLLENYCPEVEIAGTSNSPIIGRQLIEEHNPDIVFMDIEMPGMSGIDLVRSFINPPFRVVFVTAFNTYAVEAFRLSAIDYLLKPVEAVDIVRVIQKLKKDLLNNNNTIHPKLDTLEKFYSSSNRPEPRIAIGTVDKIIFVPVTDILYCEAKGSYAVVHLVDKRNLTTSKSLGDFEEQLAGHHFFRIHHSYLINMNRIKEFQRTDGGSVVMENDLKLEVSQRKRKDFLQAIQEILL